jgi:DNA gyrase inhibitor GyrI
MTKNLEDPKTLLIMLKDWAQIARRQAEGLGIGSPEAGEKLVEAKRYDLCVTVLERLQQ